MKGGLVKSRAEQPCLVAIRAKGLCGHGAQYEENHQVDPRSHYQDTAQNAHGDVDAESPRYAEQADHRKDNCRDRQRAGNSNVGLVVENLEGDCGYIQHERNEDQQLSGADVFKASRGEGRRGRHNRFRG